ncbi:MAG: hypothetical protein Q7S36_02930 [Candidatus Liptonbacteria bacterium]|nr:hypothetical protein [Candidatus Liptonbacteria bacterium]
MKQGQDVADYLSNTGRVKRRRRLAHFLIFISGFIYFFALVAGWITLRTEFFLAKNVEVSGNSDVSGKEIVAVLESRLFAGHHLAYLLGFNNMLIWPERVDHPENVFPQIKTIDIQKDYWKKRVTIRVAERIPYGIWCESPEVCFWFDDEGVLFRKSPASQGNLIKTVTDSSGRSLGLGARVLPENFFANLLSIFDSLERGGVSPNSLEVKDLSLGEVAVGISEGPDLYFSLQFSSANTPDILKMLKSGSAFSKLQYVDLRIPNRAYYK